jgi:spore photoproduct lyase
MQSKIGNFGAGTEMSPASFSISEAHKEFELKPDITSLRINTGGPISSVYKEIDTIIGSKKRMITQVADGSIITLFDKTPTPKLDTDVVCPHFMELKWANGCNYNCSWCYLNGTLRFRPMGKDPYLKNKEKIIAHIEEYLRAETVPSVLNSGELSDSLVYEGKSFSLSNDIIPLFKEQKRHKLLLVTKSSNVSGILKSESQKNIIVSFSINALPIAKKWEKKAPSPEARIQAAGKLHETGYKVRLRIDPMVPVRTWKKNYSDLIDLVYQNLEPERITFGSLRGLQSTINFCKDKSWTQYLNDRSNWGLKAPDEIRQKMYSMLIGKIQEYDSKCDIAMCKETVGMWREIGMDWKRIKCNCTL